MKTQGLHPKPIDDSALLNEIISHIKDKNNNNRAKSLEFFIYNVLPGTTSAAEVKSKFLKKIILSEYIFDEIDIDFAFELLSHMKGGPSVEVLLDLALDYKNFISKKASNILKTQVFGVAKKSNKLFFMYFSSRSAVCTLSFSHSLNSI